MDVVIIRNPLKVAEFKGGWLLIKESLLPGITGAGGSVARHEPPEPPFRRGARLPSEALHWNNARKTGHTDILLYVLIKKLN